MCQITNNWVNFRFETYQVLQLMILLLFNLPFYPCFLQAKHIMAERNVLLMNVKHPFLVVRLVYFELIIVQ